MKDRSDRDFNVTIVISFGAVIFLIFGAALLTQQNMDNTIAQRKWVLHTQEVLILLSEVDNFVKTVETGQQDYLLTRDQQYLKEYQDGTVKVHAAVEHLRNLTSDNPVQVKNSSLLASAVQTRFAELKEGVDSLPVIATNTKQAMTKAKERRSSRIQHVLTAMNAEERRLLLIRTDALQSQTETLVNQLTMILVAAIGIVAATAFLIAKLSAARANFIRTQRIVNIVGDCFQSSSTLQDSINEVPRSICEILNYRAAAVWQPTADRRELYCASFYCTTPVPTFEEISRASRFKIGDCLPGRVWQQKKPCWIEDFVKVDNFTRAVQAKHEGLHAAQGFPIMAGETFLGVLEFFTDKPAKPDKELMKAYGFVGQSLGQLFERLYSLQKISERAKLDQYIASIAKSLNTDVRIEGALHACAEATVSHLDAAVARVWLLNEHENMLELKASAGMHEPLDGAHSRMHVGQYNIGRIAQERQPYFNNDVQHDPAFSDQDWVQREAMVAFAGYPLMKGDTLLGVLALFSRNPLSDATLAVLASLTDYIVLAIMRARSSAALEESERKFRAIFDHTFEFIGLLDTDGKMIEANKTALRFAGTTEDEVIGKPFWETPWWSHSAEHQERLQSAIRQAAAGEFVRFETTHPRHDGTIVSVDFSLKPVTDESGKVSLIIPEGRDISEKKEAEKRVNEFYSTVSHELRTPLTSIRASLGLMEGGKAGELTAKSTQLVKIAKSEAERLIRLINDMLDLGKIEAGKMELSKKNWRVSQLVETTVSGLKSMSQAANVELVADVQDDSLLFCDQDRIIQVLTNLVSNAVKFSPKDGKVTVKVRNESPHTCRFSIADQGPGISESGLGKLFGKFQQLDASDKRSKGGTGLGLAISRAIVEQHSGTIGVESKVGSGTTFWFELPVLVSQPRTMPTEAALGARWRVLLVEDDTNLAQVLNGILADDGFEVVHAQNLAAAEKALSQSIPDAIILDVHLPDGNGLVRLEKWRQIKDRSTIPVVVLTGREPSSGDLSKPLLIDWVKKPFDEVRLKTAVRMAVRKDPTAPLVVLVAEDDTATLELIADFLKTLGAKCLLASDGESAIRLSEQESPDLIILDIGLPGLDGFEVVERLRQKDVDRTPLLIYTSRDLTHDDERNLTLGLTKHLIKSRITEDHFKSVVLDLLNGLVNLTGKNNTALSAATTRKR